MQVWPIAEMLTKSRENMAQLSCVFDGHFNVEIWMHVMAEASVSEKNEKSLL